MSCVPLTELSNFRSDLGLGERAILLGSHLRDNTGGSLAGQILGKDFGDYQVSILVVQLMVQFDLAISGHLPGGPSGGPHLPAIFQATTGAYPGGPNGGPI